MSDSSLSNLLRLGYVFLMCRFIFGLLLLPLLISATPAHAEDVGCGETFEAYSGDLQPFNYVNNAGVFDGLAVEVLRRISSRAGCPVQPRMIREISWARALDDVATGQGDIIFSLVRTPEREELFQWVGPLGQLRLGLVAQKRETIRISSRAELLNQRIGVVRGSAPASLLEDMLGADPPNMKRLVGNEQQFRMLEEGRVDLVTQSAAAAPQILDDMGLNPDDFEMVYVLSEYPLYYALSPDADSAMITRMQKELDAMKIPGEDGTSEYERIRKQYMTGGGMALVEPAPGSVETEE